MNRSLLYTIFLRNELIKTNTFENELNKLKRIIVFN